MTPYSLSKRVLLGAAQGNSGMTYRGFATAYHNPFGPHCDNCVADPEIVSGRITVGEEDKTQVFHGFASRSRVPGALKAARAMPMASQFESAKHAEARKRSQAHRRRRSWLAVIWLVSIAFLAAYTRHCPSQTQIANSLPNICRQASIPGLNLHCVSYAGHAYVVADVDLRTQSIAVTTTVNSRRQTLPDVASTFAPNGARPLLVTNAGIYGDDNQPLGLLISPRMGQLHDVNLNRGQGNFFWDSAVFQIKSDQTASVVTATSWHNSPQIVAATQSGPQLAKAGKINPDIPSQSHSNFLRTAIGTDPANPHIVHIAVSREPVTLFELASFMVDAMHCADALHLDGDLSAFYIPPTGRFVFSDPGQRIVTALIVTEKTESFAPRTRNR